MTTQTHLTRKSPTAALVAEYDRLAALVEQVEELDLAEAMEDDMEWIDDELAERDLEASLPGHDDTPSLADEGIEIGSYAS